MLRTIDAIRTNERNDQKKRKCKNDYIRALKVGRGRGGGAKILISLKMFKYFIVQYKHLENRDMPRDRGAGKVEYCTSAWQ